MAPTMPSATVDLVPETLEDSLQPVPINVPSQNSDVLAAITMIKNATKVTDASKPRYTQYPALENPPTGREPPYMTLLISYDILNGIVFVAILLFVFKKCLNRRVQALAVLRTAEQAREADEERAGNGLQTNAEMLEQTRRTLEHHDYLLDETARWRSSLDGSLHPGAPEWLVRENEFLRALRARQARGELSDQA